MATQDSTNLDGADTPAVVTNYVMVGRDAGAVAPGYVTWMATSYDSAGAGYAGGTPAPIGAFVVGSAFCLAVYET